MPEMQKNQPGKPGKHIHQAIRQTVRWFCEGDSLRMRIRRGAQIKMILTELIEMAKNSGRRAVIVHHQGVEYPMAVPDEQLKKMVDMASEGTEFEIVG